MNERKLKAALKLLEESMVVCDEITITLPQSAEANECNTICDYIDHDGELLYLQEGTVVTHWCKLSRPKEIQEGTAAWIQ